MRDFSSRDWLAIALVVVVGIGAAVFSPVLLGGLIFPVAIWASVWADRKKKRPNG